MTKEIYCLMNHNPEDPEWLNIPHVSTVFFYILNSANTDTSQPHGIRVKRGQLACSYGSIARGCGLSIPEVRKALKHLESKGEIMVSPFKRFKIITVRRFDEFAVKEEGRDGEK